MSGNQAGIHKVTATLAICPICKAAAIFGNCRDGIPRSLEPQPITRTAELLLYLAGRATFDINAGRIISRDRWRIKTPSPYGDLATFADHICGDPISPSGYAVLPQPMLPFDNDLPCPF